ncbi:MAG: PD-(D/E)XK nuclease family protein [Bacteroidales bacterium]|nr:PD-(D/E)XK nuclease family protein [Bacteroidales bacterium]
MQSFLYETAKEILSKYKQDIQSYCFVFPNKRTKFFFRKHYAEIYGKSHKAPYMKEIKNLTQDFTGLNEIDNLSLIFILYKVFIEVDKKSNYNFDTFYRLGEIILSDFNEIDNWLIKPEQIFQNIKNVKEIDTHFDWLTDEQKEVLKTFWINFSPDNYSKEQEMFIELWNILPKVYNKFTELLLLQGLSYNGLKNKVLSKMIDEDNLPKEKFKKYLFIGFNALNKAEIKLFKYFNKINKAEFYWDTDKYYHKDKKQEAGDFLRKNFKELNIQDENLPENLLKNKSIDLITVPLDTGQAKILPEILNKLDIKEDEGDTAIVLADEHLLFPVLSSLPENISNINVTMGYPFKVTPLFGLIKQYVNLHVATQKSKSPSFYHKNVIDILRHPFVKSLNNEQSDEIISGIESRNLIYVQSKDLISQNVELFKLLFSKIPEKNALDIFLSNILNLLFLMFDKEKNKVGETIKSLENEYIHRAYVRTKQIREIFREQDIEVGIKLGSDLLLQVLRQEQIPFEGEAVEGLQLMGVLESRNLDFKNVIIIGMNEGNMPSVSKKTTFISQSMRFAYEMPMIKYQDAVYAYLFYSLIQRAENISLIYNSIINDSNAGELSRFVLQLQNETDIPINEFHFNQTLSFKKKKEIITEKNQEVINKLNRYFIKSTYAEKRFSPAAINTYIDCSLQFYFKYIAELKEPDSVEEEFSPSAFGSILHKTLENIYDEIKKEKQSNLIKKKDIIKIYNKIDLFVDEAFKTTYGKTNNYKIKGSQIIVKKVIINYVNSVLKKDEEYTPFEIISVEDKDKFITELEFSVNNEKKKVSLTGIIDRIDKKDNLYRVVDYKTGEPQNTFYSIDDLFDSDKKKRPKHILQTFLYALIFKNSQAPIKVKIQPAIFYVRKLQTANNTDAIFIKQNRKNIKIDSRLTEELLPEFSENLKQIFLEIFNENIPFQQTENDENCKFCSYNIFCH